MQREMMIEQLTGGYHETTPSDWKEKTAGYVYKNS
jgi:hypothetical protein